MVTTFSTECRSVYKNMVVSTICLVLVRKGRVLFCLVVFFLIKHIYFNMHLFSERCRTIQEGNAWGGTLTTLYLYILGEKYDEKRFALLCRQLQLGEETYFTNQIVLNFSHLKGSNNHCGIEAQILTLYFPLTFTYYAKRKVKRGMDICLKTA